VHSLREGCAKIIGSAGGMIGKYGSTDKIYLT